MQGEPEQAREIWISALQGTAESERLVRLADMYLVECQFEQAEDFYAQALQRDPRLASAHWGLAMMYIQRGDAEAARQAALDSDPPPEMQTNLTAFKSMLERRR